MSFSFSTNQTPATGAAFLYRLKTLLKSVGWVVKSSSDGTTYNSSGDQITSEGTGANGMGNANAWFRIQCPVLNSVNREFTFQISASAGTQWRVKYSYSAGFTGGSPGATQTPSATDEKFPTGAGGGTDASPTFGSICSTGVTNAQYCAGSSSEGYSFYAIQSSAGTISSFVCFDYLDAPAEETEPVVMFFSNASNILTTGGTLESGAIANSWWGKGTKNENWANVPQTIPYNSVTAIKAFGANPYTGNNNIISLYWAKTNNNTIENGYRGRSKLFYANLTTQVQGSTYNSKTKIQLGDFVFPWDGTTTPTL